MPTTPTLQLLAYYATDPANIATGIAAANSLSMGDPNTAGTNANKAVTNANDLSAYFASLFAPILTNPGNATLASGSFYSYTIVSSATSDYLVSTTTYGATGLPSGVTRTGATISGTLPTVSTPTNYSITLSAANGSLTGSTSFTLTINPPPPVISSGTTATGTVAVNGTLYTITASNTPTGYSVFSGTLPSGTLLSGANVSGTPTTAGTYNATLMASNGAGNDTVAVVFTIGKGSQAITSFGSSPALVVGGTTTVSATGGASGNPVTFTSTTPSVCSVAGSTVTGLTAGTCTIAANQASSTNYNAAPQVTLGITGGPGSQTITFGTAPTIVFGGSGTVSATGGASGNPVTFTSTTPGTCSVSGLNGSTVTGVAAGTCTIAANQASSTNYNAAPQVTQSFAIGQASQTITFGTAPVIVYGSSGLVSATSNGSSNPVTFTSTTPSVCTVSGLNGSTVTGVAAGTCTVAADQASTANYSAAPQVTQSFTISQASQTITFGAAPTLVVGGSGTVSATGGTSGNPVTFTSTTPLVCTVSGTNGSTVTGLAAISSGVCIIAANQAGNTNYTAATQVTQSITVTLLPPVARGVTMQVLLNMPTTFDLATRITGYGVAGVSIVAAPTHGTVTANGTQVTYTPTHNYFGSDTFSYVASNAGGSSPPANVVVIISGRPDPTKDAVVVGLLAAQTDAAQRFSRAQMSNFQQRMESLHRRGGDGIKVGSGLGADGSRTNMAQATAVPARQYLDVSNADPSSNSSFLRVAAAPDVSGLPDFAEGGGWLKSARLASNFVSLLTTQSLDLSTSDEGAGGYAGATGTNGGAHFWTQGIVNFGNREANGDRNALDFTTSGISVGADRRFSDQWLMGVGFGFARDKTKIGNDGSHSRARGSSVAVYGSYQPRERVFVDALIGYGSLKFETQRYVAVTNNYATGNRDGYQVFGSLATGYEHRDEGVLVSPYARLDYSADHLKQSTETGAGAYALTYFSQVTPSVQGALGVRAESAHETDFGSAIPHIRVEYRHDFQGERQASIAYADLINGPRYALSTGAIVRNALVLGIGNDIVMRGGLSISIDYQLLRASSSKDRSQSIGVKISQVLGQRGGLSRPPLGIQVDAGFMFDDNVTRAKEPADKYADRLYSLNLSKVLTFPVTEHGRVLLTGSLGGEKSDRYDGLSRVIGGIQGEYQYRHSAEFSSPTLAIFAKAFADQFESDLRDGYRYSSGFSIRQPVTDRIHLFGALAHNERNSKSAVFDTHDNSVRLNLDYATTQASTLYLGGEFRRGDIVSTGSASLENIDTAKVFVQDDAFPGGQLFSYRFEGKTVITTVGYNMGFGARDSLDFSWRRIRSTADWRAAYATSASSYIANQFTAVYLVTF